MALNHHLVLGYSINLAQVYQAAESGKRPHHIMGNLSRRLDAQIHTPGDDVILPIDRIRSGLVSRPHLWALARTLAPKFTSQDLVYCTGEDIGIPIMALCAARPDRPKIVVFIHGAHHIRNIVAMKLFQAGDRVDLFVTNCQTQVDFLHNSLNFPLEKIYLLLEQTDTQFFTPGPVLLDKPRPMIASVGLEKRDYRILAEATADLEVDVKISGFSKDVKAMARSFPKVMPPNMSRRFYEWTELVQLYRDADLVVVSLFKSIDTCGVTTLLEAMACQCPVIVTGTEGLADYLKQSDTLIVVQSGDLAGLRDAIRHLLQNPQVAKARSLRGYEQVTKYHNPERYTEMLATRLAMLEETA